MSRARQLARPGPNGEDNRMTPRPKTVSDEQILEATARVIGRSGPHHLTLSEVGSEAGLSAATLLQRFGSKRELLLALAAAGAGSGADLFDAARARRDSAVDALIDVMACMGRMARTPEEMAHHLAFLQMDLSDADFHHFTALQFQETLTGIESLLDEAVAGGEMDCTDTRSLARAVQSMSNGAILNWAIHRQGTAEEAIRADLRVLLAPYRPGVETVGRDSNRRSGSNG
jgi:AcrR family transcriptional regulator